MDLPVPGVILAAGLEHQDPVTRILAEPVGQDTPGRPGADDDIVVASALVHTRSRSDVPSPPTPAGPARADVPGSGQLSAVATASSSVSLTGRGSRTGVIPPPSPPPAAGASLRSG